MKINTLIKDKKIVLLPIILLSAIIISFLVYFTAKMILSSVNGNTVSNVLSSLTYTENSAEDEFAALMEQTELNPLSDIDKGKLYRAMSEISYMAGDDMTYNKYAATALYYSKKAGDSDTFLYIYSKYVGRLYANGCYNSAKELIDNIADTYDVASLPLETQCSYFLSYADTNEMLGVEPDVYLLVAKTIIEQMPESNNRQLMKAKLDLLSARNFIYNNDFESAESILTTYSEDDDFGLGINHVYVVCDYRIPFYEISAKLALNKKDVQLAREYADKYIASCDSYNFRAMKLNLLKYMADNSQPNDVRADNITYSELEKETATENLNEMTEQYGQFLLSNIEDVGKNLEDNSAIQENSFRNIVIIISSVYIVVLLYCIISVFTDYENRDGLTKLKNRKMYDKAMHLCERRKIPHCLIMFDIDDFKTVNDTYGHERGDDVLRRISVVLNSYSGHGLSAYRYGGEELCLILLNSSENQARKIAEEIRISVCNEFSEEEPHVTISGGIGVSVNGESVRTMADKNLYKAKRNGKNQIV